MRKLALLLIVFYFSDLDAQWQETAFRTNMNSTALVTKLYYDGTSLWAGSRSTVYRSADKGNSWENVTSGGITVNQTDVKDIIQLGEYIYVAFGGNGNKQIYRSKDNGKTWEADMAGYTQFQHVTNFYTYKDYVLGKLETKAVIYKKNSDSQWSTLVVPDSRFNSPVTIFSKGDSLILTSGQGGPAIALTVNMGQTWTTRVVSWGNEVPANGDWLVPAVWHGRYNKEQMAGVNRGFVTSPRLEYVYNFLKTNDGMYSFTKNNTFFQTENISTIWFTNDVFFVAYTRSNVWKSTDGGQNFTDITGNLKGFVQYLHLPILSMEVVDDKLFVAGNQNGILVSSVVPTSVESTEATLSGVFPNSAKDKIKVYSSMENAFVRIISSEGKEMTGRRPLTLTDELNIAHFPKGMYIVQVLSAEKTEAHKIIKQ